MNAVGKFLTSAVVRGALILLPVYLAVLVLLSVMESLAGVIAPIAAILPDWVPGDALLSLLIVLLACLVVGAAARTTAGRVLREWLEQVLFARLPGYRLFRSVTGRLAGEEEGHAWQPALLETDDALVPAFIVEEIDAHRIAVFVPSSPTPFAGQVFILARERVHPVAVSFSQAIQSVTGWGAGSKALVAAMTPQTGA